MISRKDEYSIRSGYPVPPTPLERLIAKETPPRVIELDAEVLIFMADFSAQYPEKWRTVKEKINVPGLSYNDLAERLNISRSTVVRHLADLRQAGREWLADPAKKEELIRKVKAGYGMENGKLKMEN